jgi:RNA polymerase sigma-70 factor (ECF subfamily)
MTMKASVEGAWQKHRPYLTNLAYQMLGDIGDAEDAVQEAFLRLSRETTPIDDVRGWLTVVTGRVCLDQLRSARARREEVAESVEMPAAAGTDPAERVTLDDQVSGALFEVLSLLTPGERVAFVLHDVFGMPFEEIALTVGRPVGTCRQLARRARNKFVTSAPVPSAVSEAEHREVTERFINACGTGDLDALTAVLDPTVWGAAHFLGDQRAPQVNHGPHDVAVNLLRHLGPGVTLVDGPAGQDTLLAFSGRRLFAVVVLTVRDRSVCKIEATADPSART